MADRLLTDKGASLTLKKRTGGTYDPATATATVSETSYTVTGAVFDYPARAIDGTLIQQGDKKVLASAVDLTVDPDIDDYLNFDSMDHRIVRVRKISPAGLDVVWELQVRTP
jgi:hypothetical protein